MAKRKTLLEKLNEAQTEYDDAEREARRKLQLKRAKAKLDATGAELQAEDIDINDDEDVRAYLSAKSSSATAPKAERKGRE